MWPTVWLTWIGRFTTSFVTRIGWTNNRGGVGGSHRVKDFNEDAAVMAFRNGLPADNSVKELLIKRTPFDLRDLMGRAEKYAKVEEESKLLKQVVAASHSSPMAPTPAPATKRLAESRQRDRRGNKDKK
ncbi:hypothetical protein QJS04_geneDACA016260 [Acorus gramineus]|uniref:Uncharacterized protein n=1 Tax=Acorus gramineus TaxID=55184 RepID=A0AAV9AIL0_ACOGR|nr:hypothetical protein QJS04_geneDACA016260 [Acorus gramineus]